MILKVFTIFVTIIRLISRLAHKSLKYDFFFLQKLNMLEIQLVKSPWWYDWLNEENLLGDPELNANLYCNFAYLY